MIRPLEPDDLDAVLALNQANVPEVGPLDASALAALAAASPWSRIVEVDGAVEGFMIGLAHGVDYASPNYRWFVQRHPRFAYVDRIALAPGARGAGHAVALYQAFATLAHDQDLPVLCAEVNLVPPNPRSLRFHHRFGFTEVGQQVVHGSYRVALLEKVLGQEVLGDGAPGGQS